MTDQTIPSLRQELGGLVGLVIIFIVFVLSYIFNQTLWRGPAFGIVIVFDLLMAYLIARFGYHILKESRDHEYRLKSWNNEKILAKKQSIGRMWLVLMLGSLAEIAMVWVVNPVAAASFEIIPMELALVILAVLSLYMYQRNIKKIRLK
jgi:hypothetical protein